MIKLLLALSAAGLATADAPSMLVSGDRMLSVTAHGMSARIRVDPGAPTMPAFNPDFATRAGFKSGWLGTMARIGPVTVGGRSAVIRLDMGKGEFKRRVTWFVAPIADNADGLIGPGGLPATVVTFAIHAPVAGENKVSLPLVSFGYSGMGTIITLGDAQVKVLFSLDRERSIATAGAGAAIAAVQGGSLDGPTSRMVINLAVARPIRHLGLATPLRIGPLALHDLLVRTGDFGSAAGIPDKDAPPADPDEIVVTGEKKQKRRLRLDVGRDYLDRCSSIVFDKQAKTLTLSCR